jgi:hypothetical protein
MKNIYGKCNSYKTKEDPFTVLTQYRKKIISLLQEGFNPYHENPDLYTKRLNQERVPSGVTVTSISVVEGAKLSLKEVFQLYLKLEEMQINPKNQK